MEVLKDEVSRSSWPSSTSASCFASNEVGGWDKLLKATLKDEGMMGWEVGQTGEIVMHSGKVCPSGHMSSTELL